MDAPLTGYDDRVGGARARSGARRRARLSAALAALALAVLGYAAFEFTGHVTGHAALTTPKRVTGHNAAAPATPRSAHASQAAATAAATTPATTPAAAAPPPLQTIVPVSAVAFGPQGTADGDNPQNAARVLTDPSSGWLTAWYTTPNFGNLQAGTGLLLDMGRTVTITTVRITLGGLPGANLELRAGAVPEFGALPVVTTATDAGDLLNLRLAAPARARYVLLWFTRLPPDGAGTYQVLVHQVTVQGRP